MTSLVSTALDGFIMHPSNLLPAAGFFCFSSGMASWPTASRFPERIVSHRQPV